MKTYTLKAVLIFTALTFIFPAFILAVAALTGVNEGKHMLLPYIIFSFMFLTYFYTRFIVNKFKLPESIVFAFIVAGIVSIVLFKVCLVVSQLFGLS